MSDKSAQNEAVTAGRASSGTPARRNAIVTGAASGLGRAISVRLARDGWRIALADIDAAGSEETLRLVTAAGGEGQIEPLDVTKRDQWAALRDRLSADWPQLDLLVNNAGVCGSGEVGRFPLDDWNWLLDVTLLGCVYGCHTFVDWLKLNPQGGHVINTASFAAMASAPGMGAYNVAKAGVLSLSETLYAELLPQHVGVTVLCPVFFQTNLVQTGRFNNPTHAAAAEALMREARFTADDVADAAVRAMYRKQLYVVLDSKARWLWRFKRLAPTRFLKAVSKMFQKRTGN